MKPKGKVLIIGGAEDRGDDDKLYIKEKDTDYSSRLEILRELLPKIQGSKIEIITSGTLMPDIIEKEYERAFKILGYYNPGFMHIKNKMQAREKKYTKRIEAASVVFFTGGDQFRLVTILGGTPVERIIHHRYLEDKNFLVAGTSAGAMVMSKVMIIEGGDGEVLTSNTLKTSSGLGILHNCIIDTHFLKRGRFGRLAHAIITNPNELGIGLGDNTALIIKNGRDAEVRGTGAVIIIDGRNIKQTNITEVGPNEPIFVENLRVHILVRGCRFSIKSRKLLEPVMNPKKKHDEF